MIALLVVILLTLGVGLAFYINSILKRAYREFKGEISKKAYIVLWVITIALAVMSVNIFSTGAILLLHIIFITMLLQFVSFIFKKLFKEKYENGFKLWKKLYLSGGLAIAISALFVIFGYMNMMNIVETDVTIHTDKNITEDVRVALIADVHFGVSVDEAELKKKCEEISKKDVDIVILCGDIVDENTTNEGMKNVFETFGSIENKYGIYYVYGNHDRQLYRDEKNRAYSEEELAETIEKNGIVILRDSIAKLDNGITIVGREDASYIPYLGPNGRTSVKDLLASSDVDKDDFILMLDHQPKDYMANEKAGTDLLLSGHTHGGQIWPANIFMNVVKFDDAVYGYTKNNDFQAFVTSGFAGWGYTIKTAAPAEYVIIDIKK